MIFYRSAPCVFRLVTFRPIPGFPGKIGPGLMGKELGNIDGFLLAESVGLSQRHIVLDEGCCGIGTRHTGADIKRVLAPHRWE